MKAGAKRYGNENLVVKVNYRDNNHNWNGGILKARSAYIHESPSLNSPSNKELVSQYTKGGIIQYTTPMDRYQYGNEGHFVLPHSNVKGKVHIGWSTEPDATSAMSNNTIGHKIFKEDKSHIYPVYKVKKKCVIIEYHGGKPAAGSSVSSLKTRYLVSPWQTIKDCGYVTPVRSGYNLRRYCVRNYYGWGSIKHSNGTIQWPKWIRHSKNRKEGRTEHELVEKDEVWDAVWLNYGEKTLDKYDIFYIVSEHTDNYGRKYYTYKITDFLLKPDTGMHVIIPRTMKVWYKIGRAHV